MINLRFSCAALGAAGYSQASRDYISAMSIYENDINLSVKSANFEPINTDQSLYLDRIKKYFTSDIEAHVNIIHMVPDLMTRFKVPNIPNIGYTVWETTRLPERWVKICNSLSEVWVPSQWNVDIFKQSGVTVPVKKVCHTIDLAQFSATHVGPPEIPANKFVFYSIFQWNERKNPAGLIRAYLSEFKKTDSVTLILKTYKKDGTQSDKDWIRDQIINIRKSMHLSDPPEIILLHKMMSRSEILGLHASGDCLVSPHRSEGWGYSMQEALASGTPVIATGFSGNMEFTTSENSYLINHTMTPVHSMEYDIYSGRSEWAEPDLRHLKDLMRHVYENKKEAYEKAMVGKEQMEKYSWKFIGQQIVNELKQVMSAN